MKYRDSLTYLQQIKCRKHASQVSVVDDEEIRHFPGLDVDGRLGFHPVANSKICRLIERERSTRPTTYYKLRDSYLEPS